MVLVNAHAYNSDKQVMMITNQDIVWPTRYTGCKLLHPTRVLYFLVLRLETLHRLICGM